MVFEIDENYEENSFRVEAQNILKLVKKMYNQTEFKIRAITIDDITSRMSITRNKVRLTIRFSNELKTFLREVNKTRIIDRKPVYDNYINFKKLFEQNEDISFVCEKMGFSKRQFYYYRSLTNKISKLLNK